jgi:hypothetical protein
MFIDACLFQVNTVGLRLLPQIPRIRLDHIPPCRPRYRIKSSSHNYGCRFPKHCRGPFSPAAVPDREFHRNQAGKDAHGRQGLGANFFAGNAQSITGEISEPSSGQRSANYNGCSETSECRARPAYRIARTERP